MHRSHGNALVVLSSTTSVCAASLDPCVVGQRAEAQIGKGVGGEDLSALLAGYEVRRIREIRDAERLSGSVI